MSISTVILRGYNGPVAGLITRGYSLGAPAPEVAVTQAGAGHPVYWQGKRKKLTLKDRPERHLDWILNNVVSELYSDEVVSSPDISVKVEALVRPFIRPGDQQKKPVEAIDWLALVDNAAMLEQLNGILDEIAMLKYQQWLMADEEDVLLLLLGD